LANYPYDASKACADILARTYHKTYGLPVAVSRCSNIYGGGDLNFSRIIPGTIQSVLLDRNPIIRSDGSPVRDYMYISDAVNAYITLAEKIERADVKGQPFNFGTLAPLSVLQVVKKIIEAAGKTHLEPSILGQVSSEIQSQYLSSEKAHKILDWTAKVSIEKGLKETISWFDENRALWVKD
jgi:CDP-glucose 4,6-dehydratase